MNWKWMFYIFGWFYVLTPMFWGYHLIGYFWQKDKEFFSKNFHLRTFYFGLFMFVFTITTILLLTTFPFN